MPDSSDLPAFIGRFRGPCAFCGHPDARHRMVDTITERYTAGETVEALAQDYRCTVQDLRNVLETRLRLDREAWQWIAEDADLADM